MRTKVFEKAEIDQAGITDAGTKDIGRLTELTELSFYGCQGLSDATTRRLLPLEKLEILDLSYCRVTDAGVKQIAGLRTLKTLGLCATETTDAGLAPLANLACLEHLNLASTPVSDACLVHLAGIKKLSWLQVNQTAITDDGVDRIRKAMPKLRVWPDHPNH
ncbi:MAG: leucine-rich repeat domain-containing protein [Thermoguttaceae bacterium]